MKYRFKTLEEFEKEFKKNEDGSFKVGEEEFIEAMFHLCGVELPDWAAKEILNSHRAVTLNLRNIVPGKDNVWDFTKEMITPVEETKHPPLKVGDRITAIDSCGGYLTVSKEYFIREMERDGIVINNDRGRRHSFTFSNLNQFFKLPETEQPGKFYPFTEEMEMLVWEGDESKAVKRTVFGRRNGKFLTWNSYDKNYITPWKNAKPIPETLTVTMQEIAEWKGVSLDQIKIVDSDGLVKRRTWRSRRRKAYQHRPIKNPFNSKNL